MDKRKINLIDTTLRDGAQGCNTAFSYEDKLHIAEMLTSSGLSHIEAGIPAMGEEEIQSISEIKRRFPQLHVISWCRALKSDIDLAAKSGCDSVHISLPASSLHQRITGIEEEFVLDICSTILQYALPKFDSVSIGAQDASRADPRFLTSLVLTAKQLGACRVRIADTVGILTPRATESLISGILSQVPDASLEFHAHNDLGMATANTVTAIQCGADSASVTLCGLGERAGNAALEEVAVALNLEKTVESNLNLKNISQICHEVYQIIKQPIPFGKPVVGKGAFKHESGIHCQGLLEDSRAYEPYSPESVGQKREFLAGTHSGTSGVIAMLSNSGISISRQQAYEFLETVRHAAVASEKALHEEDVAALYKSCYA